MQCIPKFSEFNFNNFIATISLDECNERFVNFVEHQETPLLRLNSDSFCLLNDLDFNEVITIPHGRSIVDVFTAILRKMPTFEMNIVYDDAMDHYATQAIHASQLNQVQAQIQRINQDADVTEINEVINKSRCVSDDVMTAMVLCDASNTIKLFEEIHNAMWNSPDFELRSSLYFSFWLFFCKDKTCISRMKDLLSGVVAGNFAVIFIEEKQHLPLLDRIEDRKRKTSLFQMGFDLIARAIVDNEWNSTKDYAPRTLLTSLNNMTMVSPQYLHCQWYTLYVVQWDFGTPSLRESGLCYRNGTSELTPINPFPNSGNGLNGRKLRVYTMVSPPFVIINTTSTNISDMYYGICIAMLKELSQQLNFTYTLGIPADGQYGGMKDDGNFTGLVGLLQNKEADLVVASLSVTFERDTVMDFVHYFYEYGGALMRKPNEDEDKWRVIIQPFSWRVWLCILASVPIAGISACVITSLAWKASSHRIDDQFRFVGISFWYTFGTVLTQGGVHLPKYASSRNFICSWWAFSMVIVAAYGGSLIAYLTVTHDPVPFRNLDEMVQQKRYKWGTTNGSVYVSEFGAAKGGVYRDVFLGMQEFVKTDPTILSTDRNLLINKAEVEDFALILDRTVLLTQALLDKNCEMVVMPEGFLPLPFGIGLQEGSPYQQPFKEAVMKLRQTGLIEYWQRLWYPNSECSGLPMVQSHAITLMDTQSAFYLLILGVIAAFFMLVVEFCWLRKKRRFNNLAVPSNGATLPHSNGAISLVHLNGATSGVNDIYNGNIPQSFTSLDALVK
ncbi:hypothetical protein CAPTEDRAFT_204960 [Capitella teleta]|uniref:Ionotropic glutamate receptor C-terminal domain-containing protein n=1 Tax=Capitella teleta TaxID=283909 RepID=R7TXE3_CAPTE|nr:hypothetical protein CAPTEDRAFT_204960 [Capitella teleta]|eukprot:ELT98379.1 hypothetical protein CAPTEDRAFT_204960 [Capitella teleta]